MYSSVVPFSEYFEKGNLTAFLVIKNDTILYEKYSHGYEVATISNTFSIGKTIISILIGKAKSDGFIKNFDQKIIEFIPELKPVPNFDKITIQHLLDMKSGLSFDRAGKNPLQALFSDEARLFYTNDLKRNLLEVEADTFPNVRWKYSNLDPLFLTWLLERATRKKVVDYFYEKIWNPIGANYSASWGIDKQGGLENSPSSFQCTARDLAKIGRLFLKNGNRAKINILPNNWIKESLTVRTTNQNNTAKGWQKATHQNYWWIPQDGSEGDFSAEGLRGQRLYVNPKNNIIIIQFAHSGWGGYPYRKIAHYFADLN